MLVELLQAATTTPDDVFFAVCTGWGDVPPQRFPGAALIDAPGREHFLLRGPLPGALVPVAVSGDRPVSGLRWPADRAWFVATEIDFEWTFVAGTEDLDRLAVHPQLEATRTSPDSVANLPDEDA